MIIKNIYKSICCCGSYLKLVSVQFVPSQNVRHYSQHSLRNTSQEGKKHIKNKNKKSQRRFKVRTKTKKCKKVKKNLSFKNTHQEFNTKNENNSTLFLLARVKIRLQRCWLNVSP